ncbi:MAG: DUF4331 domain-containing protein [Planctomycetota bacterium JB042]
MFVPVRSPSVSSAALAVALLASTAAASSHREAPFVTEHPKVDGTDFYMFTSYESGREGYVTLLANYHPLQDPFGGPNYFFMDPEAAYEIHVDNDGDAREDLTFRFRFENALSDLQLAVGPPGNTKQVAPPLLVVGPIGASDVANLLLVEKYSLTIIQTADSGAKSSQKVVAAGTGQDLFVKPLDHVGTKTIPNYAAYADQLVYDIALPGTTETGRVFVGQRRESFAVNLGETFDLVHFNPLGPPNGETNTIAAKNVTTFALELPKSFLLDEDPTIGGWTTASLPRVRVLRKEPTFEKPTLDRGRFVQVSRLGMPLVNEVVIGVPDKDAFNASHPKDDAQFADYVTHPTLPELLEYLFGAAGVQAPNLFPRTDLVAAFLTGVPGLNKNTDTPAEMLRLNTSIPPRAAPQQQNLGVLAGDNAGFPNGRRPGDDVVDIELRVAMGVLLSPVDAPSGQLPITDGATIDAMMFDSAFPYLTDPLPGSPN